MEGQPWARHTAVYNSTLICIRVELISYAWNFVTCHLRILILYVMKNMIKTMYVSNYIYIFMLHNLFEQFSMQRLKDV